MANSFIYDFKRTFLRFSTIFFIIIFGLAGIGVSYLVYHFTISVEKATFVKINDVAIYLHENSASYLIGYAFNNQGNPISGAKVELLNSTGVIETLETNSSGYFEFKNPPVSSTIEIIYNSQKVNESYSAIIDGIVDNTTTAFASAFTDTSFTSSPISFIILNTQGDKATLIAATTTKNINLTYTFTPNTIDNSTELNNILETNGTTVFLPNYINKLTITVVNKPEYIYTSALSNTLFTGGISSAPHLRRPLLIISSNVFYPHTVAFNSIVTSALSNAGIFASFFPILMFYLAYTIFAKPRDSGALLFLLSKPITRRELYVNRLLGGSLTGIVAALVYSILTFGIIDYLIYSSSGVLVPMNVLILSFVGIAIELVAFYSLVLMIPTFVRSAGGNLGISIFLYFLFGIIWNIIADIIAGFSNVANITKISYELDYFNPFGIVDFAEYFIENPYTIVSSGGVIHLPLVIISSALWIIIPTIIGLMRIQKIDI
ncbi:ABC transporter permease subunit [Acidianus sulfidivorans JP7]|uniref:ABC transporter permease n=1 Tax=Acidianus sulfidivorans JP7 TaxID=619593 RepID=A0A2U9IL60_9CREN|nr:ABC transporter permease subunit [Acidianus sulfidivorans]AWR96753.1 ABC transporter permease subunit [Acidianus sulfidivorans JP7]